MSKEGHPFLNDVAERIVRVLLENPDTTYTKTSLINAADVSRNAFYRRFDSIVESGVAMRTDDGDGQAHWQLNPDSKMAEALERMIYGENQ
ncbi:hypothetical protein G3I44_14165 [Halogeometricum borinquense]|uniref:ArsR family transcriptional regulator n=1 Tax=Halogeometricum borinquense TaxID=60847 RepID=A0A6C0ULU0_9EURY|nr:hypothetical protein [Halogeometricum borinquense]QIB75331.1 hypothetical protein G3I44_14165 [Halogeometricum borinquense]